MKRKTYFVASAVILTFAGALHFVRSIYGWEAVIGGVAIPLWVSWVLAAFAGYIAYYGWRLSKKS